MMMAMRVITMLMQRRWCWYLWEWPDVQFCSISDIHENGNRAPLYLVKGLRALADKLKQWSTKGEVLHIHISRSMMISLHSRLSLAFIFYLMVGLPVLNLTSGNYGIMSHFAKGYQRNPMRRILERVEKGCLWKRLHDDDDTFWLQ